VCSVLVRNAVEKSECAGENPKSLSEAHGYCYFITHAGQFCKATQISQFDECERAMSTLSNRPMDSLSEENNSGSNPALSRAQSLPSVAGLGLQLSEESSLIDVIKAREAGVGLRVLAKFFMDGLEHFEAAGHSLYRRNLLEATGPVAKVNYPRENLVRDMIVLASNNYLGLATHPKIMEAARDAILKYGTGTCSAPLLIGTLPLTNQLEKRLAEFKGTEDALVFSTGFAANLGMISCLATKRDLLIIDRLSHASIIDGCHLSGAKVRVFKHNDAEHLEHILRRTSQQDYHQRIVIVEGIYSMEGTIAPLPQIVEACQRYNAMLIVDEAHALGVLGPKGEGTVAHFGLKGQVDLVVGTMSKSLASTGGFVCGPKELINYIRYFGRANMFSAAPTPAAMATALAGLDVIEHEPWLREKLWENTRYIYQGLQALGFQTGPEITPIIPVIVGSMAALRSMTLDLHQNNICVNSIPFPAVPHGQERLRISMTAQHTKEQLDLTLQKFAEAGRKVGVI